jgi:hypothetical protein
MLLRPREPAAFRRRIEIVVIDPSAPYASGIRAALPNAKIAVDIWHLVALANQMVAEVRQRATREQLGRRGTSRDPIWVNRRLLLTGVSTCPASKRSGYGGLSTSVTPPRKSRPRGRSKNGSGCCSNNENRPRSDADWLTSTRL